MAAYTILPIEPPISPSQLSAYKTLRLTSLQLDPHSFSSNYAREVAFSEDVWRERLDSSTKRTFTAAASRDRDESHRGERENAGDKEAGGTGEWIGMANIVGPSSMHPSVLAPFKEAGVGGNWEIYAIYGMWVHPVHRGKGVGARLVKACLEWARTNVDDVRFVNESSGNFEKVVVLLVHNDNVAGRALYSSVGFSDLEGVPSREGETWMLAKVD